MTLSNTLKKRPLCLGSSKCAISCTTIYSRPSRGFLARSLLIRILCLRALQLPHLVFIFCTKTRATLTPRRGSHLAIKGGTAFFSCSRYHSSTIARFFDSLLPGRTCRNNRLCLI